MGIKKIRCEHIDESIVKTIKNDTGVNDFFAKILASKGFCNGEEVEKFINKSDNLSPSDSLVDMDKAVKRIQLAVENEESICIYGDYDADGVCATALLLKYFSDMGVATKAYIPKREDGYGLNVNSLDILKKQGVNLVITVDNGIVSFDEVDYANKLGIDVIITDHHQAKDKVPNAIAVVCPTRKDCPSEFKSLCGAGVAFKLIEALEQSGYEVLFENYGDILAIATIGDIVPLVSENRTIVKIGLEKLNMTDNIGLSALIELLGMSKKSITSTDVAFKIVPRINAAGRMEKASIALKLLISQDYDEAMKLAKELDNINSLRKEEEKAISEDVDLELAKNPKKTFDSILVLSKKGWKSGIIGITASRVVSKYGKPCFLLENQEGGISSGSGRGTEGISLFKMLIDSDGLLLKYGGHDLAAGLTIETINIEKLAQSFNKYILDNKETMPVEVVKADILGEPADFIVSNIELLNMLEPFGAENAEATFLLKDYTLDNIIPIGKNKHIKCRLFKNNVAVSVLYFNMCKEDFPYNKGNNLDIVVRASINEYNSQKSVSLIENYTRLSGFNEDIYFKSRFIFDKIMRGDIVTKEDANFVLPLREDAVKVYKFFLDNKSAIAGYDILSGKIDSNYAKVRFSIMALKERELIDIKRTIKGDIITLKENPQKTNIEDSEILKKLKTLII